MNLFSIRRKNGFAITWDLIQVNLFVFGRCRAWERHVLPGDSVLGPELRKVDAECTWELSCLESRWELAGRRDLQVKKRFSIGIN